MPARFRSLAVATLAVAGLAGVLLAPLPAAAQADGEPLARFEDALCPGVAGLRRDAAEAMVARLRANAEQFGLRMAENGDCRPNFIVAFIEDGQAFLTDLQRNRSYIFAEMERAERVRLANDPGPARALLRIRTRTRDGMPISRREDLVRPPETSMWSAHSKIYTATRNDIISALILFDREAIKGLDLNQLADYATFRALAHRLPDPAVSGEASILTLFDEGAEHAAGLTAFDQAYLRRLYSGIPNLPATARLADLEKATGVSVLE